MTRFWVGTSWKMNKTLAEARVFAQALKAADDNRSADIQRFVIPPFTAVREVKEILSGTSVKAGAQNMHWADQGAWTGEISPLMLKDCNLDIVELGHSERREHFGETNETVGLKVEAAVRHGLIPLICIGETLDDRESGRAAEVLAEEVHGALSKLSDGQKKAEILFAYEPVWAIGENGFRLPPIMPMRGRPKSLRLRKAFSDAVCRAFMAARSIPAIVKNSSPARISTACSSAVRHGTWKAISTFWTNAPEKLHPVKE